jgi:hypothetical protein
VLTNHILTFFLQKQLRVGDDWGGLGGTPPRHALPVAGDDGLYPTWDTWIDPEPVSAAAGEPALSPPPAFVKRIPAAVGGLLWPLEDGVELLSCDECKRRVRVAAFLEHVQGCAASTAEDNAASAVASAARGAGAFTSGGASGDKRGAASDDGNRRKKAKRPFNVDTMCGVICYDRGGAACMRSLSCKTHPIKAKRIVEVRCGLFICSFFLKCSRMLARARTHTHTHTHTHDTVVA